MSAHVRAGLWATAFAAILGALIVVGSRNLAHFDAALVGYTFATLFATFGITYRYAMWLQRPPTRMYWRQGWRAFLAPRTLPGSLVKFVRRVVVEVALNRFIFRRGRMRGLTHMLLMWGCLLAAAITFPLVWGWIHFETAGASESGTRCVMICEGSMAPASIFSSSGFMYFCMCVWPIFRVRPLFIAAPNGSLSGKPT